MLTSFRDYAMQLANSRTLHVAQFNVTYRCNLRCEHCLNTGEHVRYPELPTDQVLNIIDKLAASTLFEIWFSGGEVLARKDWRQILERARSHGLWVGLKSNLLLMNDEDIDFLVGLGLARIETSVYGARDVHNEVTNNIKSYDRTVANARTLRERGQTVAINHIVFQTNRGSIDHVRNLAQDMDVEYKPDFQISSPFEARREKVQALQLRGDAFIQEIQELGRPYLKPLDHSTYDPNDPEMIKALEEAGIPLPEVEATDDGCGCGSGGGGGCGAFANTKKALGIPVAEAGGCGSCGSKATVAPQVDGCVTPSQQDFTRTAQMGPIGSSGGTSSGKPESYTPCNIGRLSMNILPDGRVTPCGGFGTSIIGDLKTQSVEEIWQGKGIMSFVDRDRTFKGACKTCSDRDTCTLLCEAIRSQYQPILGAQHPNVCGMAKAAAEANRSFSQEPTSVP